MHVQILGKGNDSAVHQSVKVNAERDFTGKVKINGLKPDSEYHYRVWFGDDMPGRNRDGKVVEGQFRTAPTAQQTAAVSLAWGGDLAGQNTCRDAVEGFPIFNAIHRMQTDFFIGLGDMIYADGICETTGRYGNTQVTGNFTQAFDMPSYWAHWKYNQADQGYKKLLASTPYYAIWDDHEVVNDFGPLHDTRNTPPYIAGEHLMPKGLNAFLDYNPIAEDSATPKRLYRNVRWGKHMEMFILDTRQYRDANFAADDAGDYEQLLQKYVQYLRANSSAILVTYTYPYYQHPLDRYTMLSYEIFQEALRKVSCEIELEREFRDTLGRTIYRVYRIATSSHKKNR